MELKALQQMLDEGFPGFVGLRFLVAEEDLVRAEVVVRKELCTTPDVMHGGAIMTLADTMGAVAAFVNLPPGAGTTTLESKTNFVGAAPLGSRVIGECVPIHKGKSTMVLQTRVTLEDGKLIAVVTQTQMVLAARG